MNEAHGPMRSHRKSSIPTRAAHFTLVAGGVPPVLVGVERGHQDVNGQTAVAAARQHLHRAVVALAQVREPVYLHEFYIISDGIAAKTERSDWPLAWIDWPATPSDAAS